MNWPITANKCVTATKIVPTRSEHKHICCTWSRFGFYFGLVLHFQDQLLNTIEYMRDKSSKILWLQFAEKNSIHTRQIALQNCLQNNVDKIYLIILTI